MHRIKTVFAALLTSALLLAIMAMPASAQQTGLVNINIEDNVIQVPVAVAANICDVDVNILAVDLADDGQANCEADADGTATANRGGGGQGQGPPG